MRISDWSSDVCSSDLFREGILLGGALHFHDGILVGQHEVSIGLGGRVFRIVEVEHRVAVGQAAADRTDLADQRNLRNRALLHQAGKGKIQRRSEEHTSELQALMRTSYACVCWK